MSGPQGYCRISYEPSLDKDRLAQTTYAYFEAVNPTLAREPRSAGKARIFIHGNSKASPLENSVDVSSRYMLLRLRRQWHARLNPRTLSLEAGYELVTDTSGPLGFSWDYHLGPTTWFDTPGTIFDDPRIANFRDVQEFVACVGAPSAKEAPVVEFGGLYFIVAIDVTPTKYRILMSLAKPLTPEQVENAMKKKLLPTDMITASAPNLEQFRYVPSEWVDYSINR